LWAPSRQHVQKVVHAVATVVRVARPGSEREQQHVGIVVESAGDSLVDDHGIRGAAHDLVRNHRGVVRDPSGGATRLPSADDPGQLGAVAVPPVLGLELVRAQIDAVLDVREILVTEEHTGVDNGDPRALSRERASVSVLDPDPVVPPERIADVRRFRVACGPTLRRRAAGQRDGQGDGNGEPDATLMAMHVTSSCRH
jgi:hypothetical protein